VYFFLSYRYRWIAVFLAFAASLISKSGSARDNLDPTAYENIARVAFELEIHPDQAQYLMKYYDWAYIKKIIPEEILKQGIIDSKVLKNYLKNPIAFEHLPIKIKKKLLGNSKLPSRSFIQEKWESIPESERASLVDLEHLNPKDQAEFIESLPLHHTSPPIQIREILKLKSSAPEELKNLDVEFDGQTGSLYLEYKTPENIQGIKRPFQSLDWLMNETHAKKAHQKGKWHANGTSLHYHFSFPGLPQMEARLGARMRRFNILRSLEAMQAHMSSRNYIENIRKRSIVRFIEGDHGEVRAGTQDVHNQVVEDFHLLTLPDELFEKEISQKIKEKLNFFNSIEEILILNPTMITRELLEDIKNSQIKTDIIHWTERYAQKDRSAASIHLQLNPQNELSAQYVRMHLENLSKKLKRLPKSEHRQYELSQIELIRALGQSKTHNDLNIKTLKNYIDTSTEQNLHSPKRIHHYALLALDSFEPLSEKQLSSLVENGFLYFQEDWPFLRDLSKQLLKHKPIPPSVSESIGLIMSLLMNSKKDPRFSGVAMTFFPDLIDALSETQGSLGKEAIHGLKQLTLQAEPPWVAVRAGLALMKKGITPIDTHAVSHYVKKLEDPETPKHLLTQSIQTIRELLKTQAEFQTLFGPLEAQGKLNTLLTLAQENATKYRFHHSLLPYWEAEKQRTEEGLRCLRHFTWIQTIGR